MANGLHVDEPNCVIRCSDMNAGDDKPLEEHTMVMPNAKEKLVVDFEKLAKLDSEFRKVYPDRYSFLDFQDPNAVR